MITVYDNDNKPPRWKSWEDIKEWHYDGFSLGGAVTYSEPKDESELPYHAVMIDSEGDEGNWMAFRTVEAALLWVESQDFAAHAVNLSDQSSFADLPDDYFASILALPGVKSCRCGCGGPWFDPESDEYLTSHVECDSCGEDWPVDDCTVERHTEYADQPGQPYYFCPECSNVEDERDPKQDDEERFNMELTLGDL